MASMPDLCATNCVPRTCWEWVVDQDAFLVVTFCTSVWYKEHTHSTSAGRVISKRTPSSTRASPSTRDMPRVSCWATRASASRATTPKTPSSLGSRLASLGATATQARRTSTEEDGGKLVARSRRQSVTPPAVPLAVPLAVLFSKGRKGRNAAHAILSTPSATCATCAWQRGDKTYVLIP